MSNTKKLIKNKNCNEISLFNDLICGDYFLDCEDDLWIKTNGKADTNFGSACCCKDGMLGLFKSNDIIALVKNVEIGYDI